MVALLVQITLPVPIERGQAPRAALGQQGREITAIAFSV
jgi:hypothetical protein